MALHWLAFETRILLRQLLRSRWRVAGMATATLALGIAASTFSQAVVHHVVRQPVSALERPEQLVRLTAMLGGVADAGNVIPTAVVDALAHRTNTIGLAAATIESGVVEARGKSLGVNLSHVADGYFATLGTRPVTGTLAGALESTDASDAVVLSYSLWSGLFQFDPEVLGQRVRFNDKLLTVVGVAPEGFGGVAPLQSSLWVSARTLLAQRQVVLDHLYDTPPFHVVARITHPAESAAIERDVSGALAELGIPGALVTVTPLLTSSGVLRSRGQLVAFARLLSYLAGIVLAAAVVSASGLLLAQSLEQTSDLAVRSATGASRSHLLTTLTVEGALLASAAVVLGMAMAQATAIAGGQFLPESVMPRSILSSYAILTALLASLVCALGICILPALELRSTNVHALLGSSPILAPPPRARTRSAIVTLQFAFITLLSVGAVTALRAVNTVFDLERREGRERLLIADLDVAAGGGDARSTGARLAEVRAELRRTPGVRAAIMMSSVPFQRSLATYVESPSGRPLAPIASGGPYVSAVGHEYFQVLGLRVLQGRTFSSAEEDRRDPVVVINRDIATALWGTSVPTGACIRIAQDPRCWTVIGVVENPSRESALESTTYQLFVSPDPESTLLPTTSLLIQTRDNAELARSEVLRIFGSNGINPAYRRVSTWRELTQNERSIWETSATLFLSFGLIALLITLSGTYSLVRYAVHQRRVEFGVRMALGASPWQVARPTVQRTLRDVVIGFIMSLSLVWAVDRLVNTHTLLRLPLFSAVTLSIAVVPLGLVAGIALWTAFIKTLRREPNELLRRI